MGKVPQEEKERNAEIYRLQKEGKSYNELARMYGLTPQRTFAIVKRIKEKLVNN